MRLVVDASALIRLCEETGGTNAGGPVARELAEWHQVFEVSAPSLVAYELANVIHHKLPGSFDETVDERTALIRQLLAPISLVAPDRESITRTGVIAESLGLTAYDAAYVELADRDVDSVLVTEDKVLARQAAALLGNERVFALGERFARA